MDKEILYRFFNNSATAPEQERVLDWLDQDPAHMDEMLAERRLFDMVLIGADTEPKARKHTLSSMPLWAKSVVRYAAVIAVVVGLCGVYVTAMMNKYRLATNTVYVPAGQHVSITLSDGTKVCMNALSKLEYPAVFSGENRTVKLSGEAFFDVTHDESHPFIVETYVCNVEVLGTQFDVQARQQSGEFSTSLIEGKVRVTDNSNADAYVTLNPQQRVSYLNGKLVVDSLPDSDNFMWREGLIGFRDATFMQLIAKFEKYYGVRIEVNFSVMPQMLLTGKIRISEGLDHALWVLQQSVYFEYTRNDTNDVIYIK